MSVEEIRTGSCKKIQHNNLIARPRARVLHRARRVLGALAAVAVVWSALSVGGAALAAGPNPAVAGGTEHASSGRYGTALRLNPKTHTVAVVMPSTPGFNAIDLAGARASAPTRVATADRLLVDEPDHKILTGAVTLLFAAMMAMVMVMWRRLARSVTSRRMTWEDWK